MFFPGEPWWTFLLRPVVVYLALVAGFRLFGRRELGQMTPFDLVVILLISNALQNAMVGPDNSIVGGLIAAAALLVINRGAALLTARSRTARRLIEGVPVILVHHGEVIETALRTQQIDRSDLEQAAREHGLRGLSEVESAVLEITGHISIVASAGNSS